MQNRFFCTVACGWGAESRNFFRGCECKGSCDKVHCTCFAAKRECDPDLCRCTACTDPPNQPIEKQRCKNDSIGMHRSTPLLIGRSDISGWGVFNKNALKRGDFIEEYVGETITHEEADRRGMVYEASVGGRNYLFLIASDRSIDANRKGNTSRFMNHSDNPNVEQKSKLQARLTDPFQTRLTRTHSSVLFSILRQRGSTCRTICDSRHC